MIPTTTTIQDLEASLQNCLAQQTDCQAQKNEQQSLLARLQAERATFEQKQAAREQEQAAFRPEVQTASDMLAQARDYAKAASGTIKNAALDEVIAAEELYNEMRSQLLALTKKHQDEAEVDRPFIEDLESRQRATKLVLAQLEHQQNALAQTRRRLHTEVGQSLYAALSATLKPAREKCAQLETEKDQADEIYARLRRDAFPQLDPWPHLKRKLQEENDITDNSELHALTVFASFCEYIATHPIQDMSTVAVFEIDGYNLGAYEGGSNSYLFEERARLARARIAELQYAKR
jgi:chromosome segregation ATPase